MEDLIDRDFLEEVMGRAILAPSGHNTQPWRFAVTDKGELEVIPDFSRALRIADPKHREIYISLGCVLESIAIFAASKGCLVSERTDGIAHILTFTHTGESSLNELARAIEKRQTNRSVFDGKRLPYDHVNVLSALGATLFANGTREYSKICEYVEMGNNIQLGNNDFKQELKEWMRYNDSDAGNAGDGLSYDTLGAPKIPTFLRKSATAIGMNAGMQNRTDKKKLDSSSHIALFTSDNDTASLIDCGRRLMRFLLTAETLGVACAYMNQPCEVHTVAEMLAKDLNLATMPQVIVRLGYAPAAPRSRRRPLSDFIM